MADYYSPWLGRALGAGKYRLRLSVDVVSQDVRANSSTVAYSMTLEKDRSHAGFFGYSATVSASINSVAVWQQVGVFPGSAWLAWATWHLGNSTVVIVHNTDGTKSIPVTSTYKGANTGPAIGTVTAGGTFDLPRISRSTTPTVTPSPAVINTDVTLTLPRADDLFTHDVSWTSGELSGVVGTGLGATQEWTVPDVFNTPTVARPALITNIWPNPKVSTTLGGFASTSDVAPAPTVGISSSIAPPVDVSTSYFFGLAAAAYTFMDVRWGDAATNPVVGGKPYVFSAYLHVSGYTGALQAMVEWVNAAGALISTSTVPLTALPVDTFLRRDTGPLSAPAGAVWAKIVFRLAGAVASGAALRVTGVMTEQTTALGPFFSGDTIDTLAYDHQWVDEPNASPTSKILRTQFQDGDPELRLNIYKAPQMTPAASVYLYNSSTRTDVVEGKTTLVRINRTTTAAGLLAMAYPSTTDPGSWISGRTKVRRKPGSQAGLVMTITPAAYKGGLGDAWEVTGVKSLSSITLTDAWQEITWQGYQSKETSNFIGIQYTASGTNWLTTDGFDILELLVEQTDESAGPGVLFDGNTRETVAYKYAWTGPVGNSPSTAVLKNRLGTDAAPVVFTVITKNGAATLGTNQMTMFALETPDVSDDGAATPQPNAGVQLAKLFDVRARAVTYTVTRGKKEWEPRQPLPTSAITMVDAANSTTTCTITLSRLDAVDFPDYSVIDIDTYNGRFWKSTNHRFVLSRAERDDLDPAKTATYTGTEYVDYLLGFAYFQEDYRWDGSPAVAGVAATATSEGSDPVRAGMSPTTPGEMMRGVIHDAQKRGWGPRIRITFDGNKTSLGEPWANKAISRRFSKGTPGSQVLAGLVADGLVEYRTEYRNGMAYLILLNPGTGADYSAVKSRRVVNMRLAKIARAPRRSTMENQLTAVTVAGEDKVQVTRTRAPFDANVFGRMEGWVAASGIKDARAANTIGDNALRDNGKPTSERTFEYDAHEVAPQYWPYVSFRPNDWVLIPDEVNNNVRDRIAQVTISKNPDGISLTVLTGDRILSGSSSLAKRQSASTGSSISGGNGMTTSPLDSKIPDAPVSETTTSLGYWNSDGAAKSSVKLTWAPVTVSVSGERIRINLYEVWWRPSGIDADWALRGFTDQTNIKLGDFDVADIVDFRIRARSTAGLFGEFSEDIEGFTTLAPVPNLPGPIISDMYTDGVGSIYVIWGGILGTQPFPKHLAYVTAEVSRDDGVSYTTMGTPIMAAGSIIINPGAWDDFVVRLRPYDRLGKPGTPSASRPIALVDPHIESPVPNAPTGLNAVAGISWGASGFIAEAWFDLAWLAPTVDTQGRGVEIAGYDIMGLGGTEKVERIVGTTDGANVTTRIRVGPGETWTFRVRASSIFGGVSATSNAVVVTANAVMPAIPAPSAPTLSQYAGLLQIKWAGEGMLPQIKYVYATISTTVDGIYSRAGMPLNGAGEVVVPGLAPDTYYAKIVMVDELGTLSTSAASAVINLLPITGITVQTSPLANTGIKLTDAALTSYDVSGNPTFILNAVTGEVWIAPYDAVFNIGASGASATTGAATTGIAISSQNSSFNTFIHPSGVQIRNDQAALSWWEADAADASLVNFFSPRAVIGQRMMIGDFEMLREAKATGSRLVIRYKGA